VIGIVDVKRKCDVIVLGNIIIETINFPNGRIITPVLGSPAAYSSVILGRLGSRVGLCTKVGSDLPASFRQTLARGNVNLEGMKTVVDFTTANLLIYNYLEKKKVEYIHQAPPIDFQDIPENYIEADLFYACPMDFEVALPTIEELSARGKKIFLDLGGYGGATSSEHQRGSKSKLNELRRLLRRSFLIKASIEDSRHIVEPEQEQAETNCDEKDISTVFHDLGAERVLITLGSRGVYYSEEASGAVIPAARCKVLDVTGAGDAFAAGLIHRYLKTGDIRKAIVFGQATACFVIQGSGGVDIKRMPEEDQIYKLMSMTGDYLREQEASNRR
jgi:sugar/nucleoside kinase (ribokinase family)